MIEITKQQGYFYLRHIVQSYMLGQGWGKKDEHYGWAFSVKEWQELEEHIERLELPSGYYDLCDLLGESYSMEYKGND